MEVEQLAKQYHSLHLSSHLKARDENIHLQQVGMDEYTRNYWPNDYIRGREGSNNAHMRIRAQAFTNATYPGHNLSQATEQLREAHLLFDQNIIRSVSRVDVLARSLQLEIFDLGVCTVLIQSRGSRRSQEASRRHAESTKVRLFAQPATAPLRQATVMAGILEFRKKWF